MIYALLDTFRGPLPNRDAIGDAKDLGHVLSCHRTEEAAERASEKIQRDTKHGHGRNAYLPTMVVPVAKRLARGTRVTAGDVCEA